MRDKETHCDVEMIGHVEVKLKVLNQKMQQSKKEVIGFERKETHYDVEMKKQVEVKLKVSIESERRRWSKLVRRRM